MKAVAVCLTYGRASFAELLGCWARQSRAVPLVVWVDDAEWLRVEAGPTVDVFHGPPFAEPCDALSVTRIRNASIDLARRIHQLAADDVIMVLDDDDFYSPAHAQVTLGPFDDPACEWVGGLAMGLEPSAGADPVYLCADGGQGQHATWAYRLGLLDRAGGYKPEEVSCDPGLSIRMGWSRCRPHHFCTHVRAHHAGNLSGPQVAHARAQLRTIGETMISGVARPEWSPRCERLAIWCAQHFTPRAAKRSGSRVPSWVE